MSLLHEFYVISSQTCYFQFFWKSNKNGKSDNIFSFYVMHMILNRKKWKVPLFEKINYTYSNSSFEKFCQVHLLQNLNYKHFKVTFAKSAFFKNGSFCCFLRRIILTEPTLDLCRLSLNMGVLSMQCNA